MNKLNFYHQKRKDGGLRTGIDYNDERILERFNPGDEPQDSALLWFIDIRCQGEGLPSEPEAVRRWFLSKAAPIQTTLQELSANLQAGIDSGWPLRMEIPTQDDVHMAIFCSAIRRLSGREISGILSDLGNTWGNLVNSLEIYAHPVPANG